MKNTPLIIDILGYKYKVTLSDDIKRRGREGECDPETEVITISSSLSGRAFAETLLHEILHAITVIGLDEENRLTELQVNYLAAMLIEVLRRNPPLKGILMP